MLRKSSLTILSTTMVSPKVAGWGTISCVFHSIKIRFLRRFDTTFCHLILLQQTSEISYITVWYLFALTGRTVLCFWIWSEHPALHFEIYNAKMQAFSTYHNFFKFKSKLQRHFHVTKIPLPKMKTWPQKPTYLTWTWKLVGDNCRSTFFAIVVNYGQSQIHKACSSSFTNATSDHKILTTEIC